MTGSEPLVSFVVTSRNDDHGGNLLHRMQVFVTALIAQCDRHGLSAELIIVEWNPPSDRPGLKDALKWPDKPGHCQVRIIRVPERLHRKFKHADVLPLFQMIAKNVGIRRCRGKFILATNIDIIFSDELIREFVSGRLKKGEMYRVDRYDVMSDLHHEADVDEQIEYCRTHQIRLNVREGTFAVKPDGSRRPEQVDIAEADGPIAFGRGWYGVERGAYGKPFRWVGDDAELLLTPAQETCMFIHMDVEPGPGVRNLPFVLRVRNEDGETAAEGLVRGGEVIQMKLPVQPGRLNTFHLETPGGGRTERGDPRTLNFRVMHCCIGTDQAPRSSEEDGRDLGIRRVRRTPLRDLRGKLRSWVVAMRGNDVIEDQSGITLGSGWYGLETDYRGRKFRWVNNGAEFRVDLTESKCSPMFIDMEVGPGAQRSALELEVLNSSGEIVAVGSVRRRKLVRVDLPIEEDEENVFTLRVHGGGRTIPQDPRILNFRVFRCGWNARLSLPFTTVRLNPVGQVGDATEEPLDTVSEDSVDTRTPVPLEGEETLGRVPSGGEGKKRNHAHLHTNACGDFTMMAREHWFDLRGYPEFEMFSMNIDSVLCYAAHYGGAREVVLDDPCRIYHIEHSTGSGWTPEGQEQLFERLRAKNLPFVGYEQVMAWASEMWAEGKTMIFSGENWGLAGEPLEEIAIGSASRPRSPAAPRERPRREDVEGAAEEA